MKIYRVAVCVIVGGLGGGQTHLEFISAKG